VKKVNSLYTGAKVAQLERSDLKNLPDHFSDKSSFSLSIANEENEDQFFGTGCMIHFHQHMQR